jgi:hypothetical protein
MSSVVGGIAYALLEQGCKCSKEAVPGQLAEDECLANDPFRFSAFRKTPPSRTIGRIRRLQALHRVCHYSQAPESRSSNVKPLGRNQFRRPMTREGISD